MVALACMTRLGRHQGSGHREATSRLQKVKCPSRCRSHGVLDRIAYDLRRVALNEMSTPQRQRIGGARGKHQELHLLRLPTLLQALPELRRNERLVQKSASDNDVQWNVSQ